MSGLRVCRLQSAQRAGAVLLPGQIKPQLSFLIELLELMWVGTEGRTDVMVGGFYGKGEKQKSLKVEGEVVLKNIYSAIEMLVENVSVLVF